MSTENNHNKIHNPEFVKQVFTFNEETQQYDKQEAKEVILEAEVVVLTDPAKIDAAQLEYAQFLKEEENDVNLELEKDLLTEDEIALIKEKALKAGQKNAKITGKEKSVVTK